MNLTLWIATALLATVALAGGVTKAFTPKEKSAAHDGGNGPGTPAPVSSGLSESWRSWPRCSTSHRSRCR
ncbi:hypothetical protein ACWCPQ_13915 [Nocardia sp. NPDC001965]